MVYIDGQRAQSYPRAHRPPSGSKTQATTHPVALAIRARRVALDMGQLDLAEKAGVCSQTMQRMEAGVLGQWQNVQAVMDALGLEFVVRVKESPD